MESARMVVGKEIIVLYQPIYTLIHIHINETFNSKAFEP